MKVIVLNGSPKGDMSVTLQYVHYMQKKMKQHEFIIANISQQISAIEKNENLFCQLSDKIRSADGVLWAFPLYFLLVHSNYKRFIELIWEKRAEDTFIGKYSASLSTSIHFYDHVAHNYINSICDDLDMKYVGAFSADMYDLLDENERRRLILFAEHFFEAIQHRKPTSKNFGPVIRRMFEYVPGDAQGSIEAGDKKVSVLTDSKDMETNLGRMIHRFTRAFSQDVQVFDLDDFDMRGGCLGCLQCAYDNRCVYGDKDGYVESFNTKVKGADILVFAGSIKDRYLSSKWKLFFDRSFFYNHAPVLAGKQIGFIISGPLSQIPNLRQALEAYCEMQHVGVADFITDEFGDSVDVDGLLENLAETLIRFAQEGYVKPHTFLGVGGKKVFRDDIYSRLRFPFRADHAYYRKKGWYDFPQKDYKSRIMNTMMLLLSRIPSVRKEIYIKRMKKEIIKPLENVLQKE